MLAATEAIKPTENSTGDNYSAKKISLTTRMNHFSRVATFFGRVVGKGRATRRSDKREHKKGARPVISGPLERLPPTNVEIHVNEGHNLGKEKVHDAESAASAEQEQEASLRVPREGEGVEKHPSPGIANLEVLRRHLELDQEHDDLIDSE